MAVIIKLREAMQTYYRRTGERMTYVKLAEATGISEDTIESIGGRKGYQATLTTIEKLCRVLGVEIHEMIEMIPDPPRPKRTTKKKKRG